MRTATLLLLLAALSAAQDTAADIFYRAFWMERAAGKAKEAEKLYQQVLDSHARAPEAPRALLALIRIRDGRGLDVSEMVTLLATQYPAAKGEIKRARSIAAMRKGEFDSKPRAGDSPVTRKVKILYITMLANRPIGAADEDFLREIGPVAHPMLRSLLLADYSDPVRSAAGVLVSSGTPQAFAVLREALEDANVLYRTTILEALKGTEPLPTDLFQTLLEQWDGATARTRQRIVQIACGQTDEGGEIAERAWSHLVRALGDKEHEVRASASQPEIASYAKVPQAYVDELLKRMEAKDDAVQQTAYAWLPHFANRPGMFVRTEKLLTARQPIHKRFLREPKHEEGSKLLAQVALNQIEAGVYSSSSSSLTNVLRSAARWSGLACGRLLQASLDRNDVNLASQVWNGVSRMTEEQRAKHLSASADQIRTAALDASYAKDKRQVANFVLSVVGLKEQHFPQVLQVLKSRPKEPVPSAVVSKSFLTAIGPKRAVSLMPYAKADQLLANGFEFKDASFFMTVVPKVGAPSANHLKVLARRNAAMAALVARRVLQAKGAEWGWRLPGQSGSSRHRSSRAGPNVMSAVRRALQREPVRSELFSLSADARFAIGLEALKAARETEDAAGTAALVRCLQSPWREIRQGAVGYLGGRGQGDALVAFLKRKDIELFERQSALNSLARTGQKEHAAYLEGVLASRPSYVAQNAWTAYFKLAPEAAVDLALTEVFGPGGPNHRLAAQDVLSRTMDTRRIAVFRAILSGTKPGSVPNALRTVSEQYMIELGEEALRHLRNPDASIRREAKNAVEKLKFYAEARRAFKATSAPKGSR